MSHALTLFSDASTPSSLPGRASGASSVQLDSFDAAPFVAVLTAVRDAGREARQQPEAGHHAREIIDLGRRAHAVLMWHEADAAGDIESASKWLDVAYDR